ncbi:MAG: hypothetical protein CLLPBCKN_008263 [Chroococcidiopsis cubana SAG 39.79]|jgi:hypothetical protein|uniref:SH3b domain-containing protein n=2 Tax=Chroococcidiopsis TaxID=54298 RepID=A0AB37UT18_9CYAN|nr:SH3 domain-containing protein [Chroococcidiopsis cubana]MDZ4878825.1 hypothetical protein [Chroococcidiopsis cubana SAG 39.79]RUT14429.1 hypothetical protein DSM107010_04600 [Chroococcidiopsis cubana SAG 39.79]
MLKKTLLASALILTAAVPATAQVGPGMNGNDYIGSNHGEGQAYAEVCTRNRNGRLSLRTGPGQNFGKIEEIPNKDVVALNDSKYGSDGFRWWNISHNGNRGWVRADYICGDPE